jgi:hypothetical protein
MTEDDQQSIIDINHVIAALEIALEALRKATEGQGGGQREQFVFQIGFARGRLSRVSERIYRPETGDDQAG